MEESEDDLPELVLSLYHVGPRVRTQVGRFGDKCLYWLSHLTQPLNIETGIFMHCWWECKMDGAVTMEKLGSSSELET